MARKPVFFSFHYGNDVMRVQQVRNIGSLEGNTPVSANDWETVKRGGDSSIKRWIDENMKYKQCIIVLVGEETANRPWVKYEIEKAWSDGKPIFGIYIHNLKCPRTGNSRRGKNPFDQFTLNNGVKLSSMVSCHDPLSYDAYNDISRNMETWVNAAVAQRR
ncbi:TIR domain-containing protein [Yersinia enterocolitica]|uniref:TIR domain protein n=1 Tax=Yersinia rochesterensis TaxID=1604335 RepID=A0ABM5SRT6_9GAMM|nr:TIR domain-containing protein [Yersinia rochesterensis]AJI88525.1 TIR domain protein [Yersinia frederiksenii Y225]EKN4747825.1 TIR domain-containing protein [Yersinia enterocolitica]AJJ37269.1 TIR domain protein [Yersinia rochesterensis]EKN6335447.1 TIR domain-containing protein [Yersinia enterocolitica]HDT6098070.1 TIR domain-containing protein [Yersinia enterocolitica]